MKHLVAIISLMVACSASAHGPHYGYHGYSRHYYGGWIAPVIVGGVIGYEMSRPPVVVQPPVIIQQPPVVMQPQAPVGYRWINIFDNTCNCYKQVLTNN